MTFLTTLFLALVFGTSTFLATFFAVKISVRRMTHVPKAYAYKKPSSRDLTQFLDEEELSRVGNGSSLDGRKATDNFNTN